MKLLLDTHVWLWSHLEPSKIDKRTTRALLDQNNELWLSPISVWEFLVLVDKKRLRVDGKPEDWVAAAFSEAPMHEAALNYEVALMSRCIKLTHQDPADRFIAATAAVYDLVLATADERLLQGKGYKTLSAR